MRSSTRVFILIACHNRRDLTVNAVRQVLAAAQEAGVEPQIVLFDDGSSDGTAEAVSSLCPEARVIRGDGSAYWARSMSLAEALVLETFEQGTDDLFLWLNDDVNLRPEALSLLLKTYEENHRHAVVVGAVCDPHTGQMTYSGFRRYGRHPLHLAKVVPSASPQFVDSFNGNVVLVPRLVATRLGGIDGNYSHAWADLDYGFRCAQEGIPMVLAPNFAGSCRANHPDIVRDIWSEWKLFLGPKGAGNVASLSRILKRQSKYFWSLHLTATYGLWWTRQVSRRILRRRIVTG